MRAIAPLVGIVLAASAGLGGGMASASAAAVDDPPQDAYSRPLTDSQGPLYYREAGGVSRAVPGNPASATSGYQLGPYSARDVGSWPEAVAIGDVTGDGRADVVMTTSYYFDPVNDYCVFVFPQLAGGGLGAPLRFPYLSTAGRNGIALVDLDEDGLRDVVIGHDTGITVLRADGSGSLRPGVVTADGDANTLAATDVDRDGHADIISLGWNRGATIFYGDGHGGFRQKLPLATNAQGYNDHEVGDLTGDGVPDLAVMSGQSLVPNLNVHRHNGVSGFVAPPQTYSVGGALTHGVGLGDVTGDGRADAVLSRGRNSPTWLWIFSQDGSGGLTGPTTISSYDIPEPVEVVDMDRDGLEDIAVLHGGWLRLGVYLQQPGGGMSPETLYPVPYASHYSPQGLAVGDFTSDGCPDVAIADYNFGLVTLIGTNCVAPTPTQISLASVNATPSGVELAWFAPAGDVPHATVYRCSEGEAWDRVREISADGTGMLRYQDADVIGGTRRGYRLGVMAAGRELFVGEAWVTIPARFELALAGFRSNPSQGEVWAAFSLADDSPARLELFDVTGRRLEAREVGELGVGSHVLKLGGSRELTPGAYVMRLSQGVRTFTARGVVMR